MNLYTEVKEIRPQRWKTSWSLEHTTLADDHTESLSKLLKQSTLLVLPCIILFRISTDTQTWTPLHPHLGNNKLITHSTMRNGCKCWSLELRGLFKVSLSI